MRPLVFLLILADPLTARDLSPALRAQLSATLDSRFPLPPASSLVQDPARRLLGELVGAKGMGGLVTAADPYELTVHRVPAADGVLLKTLVYLPRTPGPHPLLICRTPYLEPTRGDENPIYRGAARYFCTSGYGVVIQSLRGKYGSEGRYELFNAEEIEDARSLLDWLARQAWSSGRVACWGVSHDSLTALAAACTNHPTLKLVLAGGAPANLWTDGFVHRGVTACILLDYCRYNERNEGPFPSEGFFRRFVKLTRTEPDVSRYDDLLFGQPVQLWKDLATHLDKPDAVYWKQRQLLEPLLQSRVPIVHIAGWNLDGDRPDVFRNYQWMLQTPAADRQRLVVGWWNHGQSGPYLDPVQLMDPHLRNLYDVWLDAVLVKGSETLPPGPPVQVFVPGTARWVTSGTWPLPASRELVFHLQPGGADDADGTLVLDAGGADSTLAYRTDPASMESTGLTFVTAPLEHDLQLMGEVTLDVHVSVDAPDMDLLVLLERPDASPDWGTFNLIGAARLRFHERNITPGDSTVQSLRFGPFAHVIPAGERLGIYIASQLPDFMLRNNQTGNPIAGDDRFQIANQVIHMGRTHPSRLTLRVLPADRSE